MNEGCVRDKHRSAGDFELVAELAFAIAGIDGSWDSSGEGGGVVGGGKFPAIGEKDADDFTGPDSGCDETTGNALDAFAIFGVGKAKGWRTGSIDESNALPVLTA